MSTDKMREEFELELDKYLLRDGWNLVSLEMMKERDSNGEYTAARTAGAWWAWQASRENIRVDLPHLFPFYRQGVTEALLAHGIKVNQWRGSL